MKAKILAFQLSGEKKQALDQIGRRLGITVSVIAAADYNQTLGALAGESGFQRVKGSFTGKAFPSEMLVFCGVNSNQLDLWLAEYKKTGLEPIPLKAALTPVNARWNPVMLYMEIMKEHLTMNRR